MLLIASIITTADHTSYQEKEQEYIQEVFKISPDEIKYDLNTKPISYNNELNIILPTMKNTDTWNYSHGVFCADFPAIPVNFSLVWRLDTSGVYFLYLIFTHEYDFKYYYDNSTGTEYEYESSGHVEISNDNENSWNTLAIFKGNGNGTEEFNITPWVGGNMSIRFRCYGYGDSYFSSSPGGHWCLWDIFVQGMQDNNPPYSTIELTGNKKPNGWYNTPVEVEIIANDNESGVKEVHYVLDGVETAIIENNVSFTISNSGDHTLEYWAVDNVGNEEKHQIITSIKIDVDNPTVSIISPEPGLYLFGNKIINLNRIIIIGAFTVEASIVDDDSGVYRGQFYLNDILIGESTGPTFRVDCSLRHFGTGILKVIGEDLVNNQAEDSITITYLKIF